MTGTTTPNNDKNWNPSDEALELELMNFISLRCIYDAITGSYTIIDMSFLAAQLIEEYKIGEERK